MKVAYVLEFALLSAGLVAANKKKTLIHPEVRRAAALFSRQTDFCDNGTTCADCFGEGNIPCQTYYCYNPDAGEQCCSDGTFCVGDASCCDGGLGSPETDVSSPTPTSESSPSSTVSSPPSQSSDWTCDESDTNEECCQKGDPSYAYCPGADTSFQILCYAPADGEVCCNDGTSCTGGSDCCGSAGVNTSPADNPQATSRVVSGQSGVSLNTGRPTSSRQTGGAGGARTTGNEPAPSSTNAANTKGAIEGVAAIAVGAIGLALL
ncbi:hypothetical protein EJ05DRAFT_480452 [Pseudovirgaria hyperparasitica]|uniref:GPI anchored serine-threonine rich protein n=1 Tax=Pseudovirgaria hyperparasitica TaxID=470096 RepID=A0A6A6VTA1_9PEZI|nr:uncharacterized protein EJ05DRAFT_480452 [Pseudovirgaria hyperparasitica]KAF2753443.1 hypothetical protein EJ05DRAFT_480452 [Pseudovirgaria hyperparasitica]